MKTRRHFSRELKTEVEEPVLGEDVSARTMRAFSSRIALRVYVWSSGCVFVMVRKEGCPARRTCRPTREPVTGLQSGMPEASIPAFTPQQLQVLHPQ